MASTGVALAQPGPLRRVMNAFQWNPGSRGKNWRRLCDGTMVEGGVPEAQSGCRSLDWKGGEDGVHHQRRGGGRWGSRRKAGLLVLRKNIPEIRAF